MEGRKSIAEYFSKIKEPRREGYSKKHILIEIFVIAICAIISGANGWTEVELFAKAKESWFRKFLKLASGIPSHDTFGRVFALINPKEFEKSFLEWIQAVRITTKGEIIAIDGKTVRRSYDKWTNKSAIHIVSAWATRNHMVLGQKKVADKSNEIKAIPELLSLLDIEGCIVTIDAMGCQKDIASKIKDAGADYVLALKENHKNLYDDVKLYMEDIRKTGDFKKEAYHETVEKNHGRVEKRKYWISSDIEWLEDSDKWKGLNSIGMVESEREVNGSVSKETRFYLSSIETNAQRFGEAVRTHWGIENSLHWILDVSFREDDCRIRKDHAPENFAVLRHIALNLLKQEKTQKIGLKNKRLKCGWDNNYLEKVLSLNL